jgi:Protein of unknown function (DUF1642)
MTDKVKLPREVAEAIEKIREKGGRNYAIVRAAIKLSEASTEEKVISDWVTENFQDNLDALIIALVNGYEIEKSPEDIDAERKEKVREYFKQLSERWYRLFKDGDTHELGIGYLHRMEAVMHTLNLLGIEIPGVNAPIDGVNADA